jgi:hypothetical protein
MIAAEQRQKALKALHLLIVQARRSAGAKDVMISVITFQEMTRRASVA